jgi:hypothetical protein
MTHLILRFWPSVYICEGKIAKSPHLDTLQALKLLDPIALLRGDERLELFHSTVAEICWRNRAL